MPVFLLPLPKGKKIAQDFIPDTPEGVGDFFFGAAGICGVFEAYV